MFIYLITNSVNGKYYVGQTRVGLKKRLTGHAAHAPTSHFPLHAAIKKYGRASFCVEELAQADTQEQLDNLERLWILALDATNMRVGYNVMSGGLGGVLTPEAEARKSAKLKGQVRTAATRAKMSVSAKIRAATMWTPERRAKQSARMSGSKNPSYGIVTAGITTRAATIAAQKWHKNNAVTHLSNCSKAANISWKDSTVEERAARTAPMQKARWAERSNYGIS